MRPTTSVAMARFEYGAWSTSVTGLPIVYVRAKSGHTTVNRGRRKRGYREPTAPLWRTPMPPKRKASRAPRRSSAAPAAPAQKPEEHPVEAAAGRLQTSSLLTTAQGVRIPDTDHSLKAGPRGPSLMDDFHLREKITHFDHERIPERVVHARGAAAHGTFSRVRQRRYGRPRPASSSPAGRHPSSSGSRPCWAPGARPTPSATSAASRSSSTPTRATSTSWATTCRSSSSRTGSSSPTSFTRANRTRIARSRRRRPRTTPSGTSSRCTPRRPIT